MKICSKCGHNDFKKKDVIHHGGVRLVYKCPDCKTVLNTDLKSFVIMMIGLTFLLSGAIFLHLDAGVPVCKNFKIISLFLVGLIICIIGFKSIKLEFPNGT